MAHEAKTSTLAMETPQCQFFVQRKKRLCRMTVKPGRQYCGEHEPQPKTEAGQVDTRIPCPNDPKHTCYASKLEKHLAICNARRTEQPAYIVENINAPEAVDSHPRKPLSAIPKDDIIKLIDKINHLYARHVEDHITEEPTRPIHRAVTPEFEQPDRAESSLRHLRQTSALLWIVEGEGLVRANTCYVELGAGKGNYMNHKFEQPDRAESSLRHLRQTSALLWIVEGEGLVRANTCYVELGAGKGQLSYYACHAWCARGGRVLAVDRAPLRHKRDNKLRSAPPTIKQTHVKDADNERGDRIQDKGSENEPSVTLSNQDFNERIDSSLQYKRSTADSVNPQDIEENRSTKLSNVNAQDVGEARIEESNKHTASGTAKINENDQDINGDKVIGSNTSSNTPDSSDNSQRPKESNDVGADPDSTIVKGVRSEVGSEVAVRLRADLAHLALGAVPAVAASDAVVGIAKHLCGVATDYALRCVAAPGVVAKTRGLALATCCHHRCERALYVATKELEDLGIDAEEFNIILGIVSWATCGDGRSRERRQQAPEAHPPKYPLSRDEREAVGRRAKGLLDWGRVLWLRARGFEARLCRYVPSHVSLENVCLVARKL